LLQLNYKANFIVRRRTMTILKHNDQSGRSMVEMLGVLAIIGVLSVGGISGYSKAMAKFKLIKAQDQITMLLMNIRAAYATSPTYDGLDAKAAAEYNLAPSEMISGSGTDTKLYGAFGGLVEIGPEGDTKTYFHIRMTSLGKEACRSLATSDWGADGLVSMAVASSANAATAVLTCPTTASGTWCASDLPVTLQDASGACNGELNSIDWMYY
jgi:type II secretory pathway pseudopilin PulG